MDITALGPVRVVLLTHRFNLELMLPTAWFIFLGTYIVVLKLSTRFFRSVT